jgi:glycosidase
MTDKGKLLCIFLALFPCVAATSTQAQLPPARTTGQPDFTFTPSPPDWRALPIYQVITDRFDDGDPSNNTAHPGVLPNPHSMDGLHGGDFAGLERRLDYIAALGFRTIWISPVYLNHQAAYHGYHITDFNQVDPHWGTLEELRRLIDAAHARGLYVILDVVFNHMARLVFSDEPGYPRFREHPYRLRWRDPATTYAPPFDDLTLFHGHGSIGNWEDARHNELGDLQGLPDLITTDPRVRRALLESHLAWIAATDCDGFRVDTAHHVELGFWQEILPALHQGAAALGKTNFLIFAEALKGDDEIVARLTREGEFFSALYYPYYFTLIDWWGHRGPTRIVPP